MTLDKLAEAIIKKFASAKPIYSPPHRTIFDVAKQTGHVVQIDGELEEQRTDWIEDLMEDGVDDVIRVDVYPNSRGVRHRIGTILFDWEDERVLKVKTITSPSSRYKTRDAENNLN